MNREQLISLIQSDAKFIDERDDIAEYIRDLPINKALDEHAIRAGFERFKADKRAKALDAGPHPPPQKTRPRPRNFRPQRLRAITLGTPLSERHSWNATLPSGISSRSLPIRRSAFHTLHPNMVRHSPEWQLFTTLADQEIGVPTLRNNR